MDSTSNLKMKSFSNSMDSNDSHTEHLEPSTSKKYSFHDSFLSLSPQPNLDLSNSFHLNESLTSITFKMRDSKTESIEIQPKKKLYHKTTTTKVKSTSLTTPKKRETGPMDIALFDPSIVHFSSMDVLLNGLSSANDFLACRRYLSAAINKPATILFTLTNIIEGCKDINICSTAIKILHKIIILAHKEKTFPNDDIFINYKNVNTLMDALPRLEMEFGRNRTYKQFQSEYQIKILQIVNAMSTGPHWKNKVKYLKNDTVMYVSDLVARKSNNKDLVNQLLDFLKIMCSQVYNLNYLSNKPFYSGLCNAFGITYRIVTITDIFELMLKKTSIKRHLECNEEVILLFIEMLLHQIGKYNLTKKKIINILCKLCLKSRTASKVIHSDDHFLKLLFYCNLQTEMKDYNSQLKLYSLLNRSLKPVVILNDRLDSGLTLPSHLLPSLKESSSSNEDESDSDEKSICSSQINLQAEFEEQSTPHEPILNMSKFYREIFEYRHNNGTDVSSVSETNKHVVKHFNIREGYAIRTETFRNWKIDCHAYPDIAMFEPKSYDEFVGVQKNDFFSATLSQRIRQMRESSTQRRFTPDLVYDLDTLYETNAPLQIIHPANFSKLKPPTSLDNKLLFESRFESGNLRQAIRVAEYEYDLLLSPDTFTSHGYQWFYFEVANMIPKIPYTFNIINLTRAKSSYADGMRPLMFSILEHIKTGTGWKRTTDQVYYFSNHYVTKNGESKFHTLTFTVVFPYPSDFVYFAHHYPYTYTRLMVTLIKLSKKNSERILMKVDKLCNTVNNFNHVPMVTITSKSQDPKKGDIPLNNRPIIFLTGRVHPGESNSSWIMEGVLRFLLNETDANAITVRKHFIFKIIPMLNPEGVIYGNTRMGLNGVDLNRCWINPDRDLFPEIYHTKQLVAYAKYEMNHPIACFVDIHGHSAKKYFFLFGCNPKSSWHYKDKLKGDWAELLKIIPNAINLTNPNIQLEFCKNYISKRKESTARVVLWRDFNIIHSYTLECSFFELSHKLSVSTSLLTEIGSSLITAFANIAKNAVKKKQIIPSLCLDFSTRVTSNSI